MNVESKKERNMKKENGNDMPFKADEVNWDELSGIGIMKDVTCWNIELSTRPF